MIFDWVYKHYRSRFYDKIAMELICDIPDNIKEPALEWLADRKVLLEKFFLIQAYRIQKSWMYSDRSQDFRDGALMIIKAILAAVSQKVIQRTTVAPAIDTEKQTKEELAGVTDFLKGFTQK
jgi:hypothetical protein